MTMEFSVGGRLGVLKAVRDAADSASDTGHNLRLGIEDTVVTITPTFDTEEIRGGTLIGLYTAGVATAIQTYVPLGAETEIANTEKVDGGTLYTVNVNAAFSNQAMFRSILETGTGYTSLLVDKNTIEDEQVLRKRPLRDTYQFEVLVEE